MGGYFGKMASELLKEMTWQWWVAQVLATISIIFAFSAMQQKNTTNILWHRSIYSILVFAGGIFLGQASAIIMLGVAFVRNLILLGLSYKTSSKATFKKIKWTIFVVLAISLVALNMIFWENYLSILSMADGLIFLTAFIQSKPINVRRISIIGASTSIVFFVLVFSPVNVAINIAVLVSSIVGLVKYDRQSRKQNEAKTTARNRKKEK